MLLSPNTFRKYQDAELTLCVQQKTSNQQARRTDGQTDGRTGKGTFQGGAYQDASRDSRSMPLCSMGLNRSVRGNGTLAAAQKQTW